MFKPTDAVVAALRALHAQVGDAPGLTDGLATELGRRRPDLTGPLLDTAAVALERGIVLDRTLTAATCRAACALLATRYPGASIEVRVPPFAAVQIGLGVGPRHTRGTPPNVVEMTPATFLDLVTGRVAFADARVSASGAHAREAAKVFPL